MCVYGSKFFGWRLSVKNSRMLIFAIAGFLKEPVLFSSFRKSTHKWRIQSMQKYISVVFIEIIVGKGENYQGQWCSFSTETSYVFSMYSISCSHCNMETTSYRPRPLSTFDDAHLAVPHKPHTLLRKTHVLPVTDHLWLAWAPGSCPIKRNKLPTAA